MLSDPTACEMTRVGDRFGYVREIWVVDLNGQDEFSINTNWCDILAKFAISTKLTVNWDYRKSWNILRPIKFDFQKKLSNFLKNNLKEDNDLSTMTI